MLLIGLSVLLSGTTAAAGSYAGLSLREALTALRSEGLAVLFSDALVRGDMRVEDEPVGALPRDVLTALLDPHGLAVHDGPDGTFLVVPGRLPTSRPASRLAVRGTVRDRDTGIAVSGAEVRLDELGLSGVSAADGTFALEGMSAGVYSLEASKVGFVRQRLEGVGVRPGLSTGVTFELMPLPTTLDEIEVVPQLEVGSIHGGTLLHRTELARVPTPRDPWAVVTQTPGILSDRINVGGSESGAQALFLAPASSFEENVFNIDGVNTTDMAALGASAIYYDFDQFEELRISSGGSDVKTATAGVAIRMVTKRGTAALRGSARLLRTDNDGIFGRFEQGSSDVSDELAFGQEGVARGNEVDELLDYGLELGGPLVRDRLWAWGSYGFNNIDLLTVGGFVDDTVLENGAFKLNAQLREAVSLVASVNRGDKRKSSRGAGPGRAPETTWRQRGPTHIYKLEASHILGTRAFLHGEVDLVDSGFGLIPRAGVGTTGGEALLDDDGVWKNGYFGGTTDRDSETAAVEGSLFFDTDRLSHTVDTGGSARRYRYVDDFRWSGARQAVSIACNNAGSCGDGDLVYFERRDVLRAGLDYWALWAQDSLTAGRWTWTFGLRVDFQTGRNLPGEAPANPTLPDVLPAVVFEGADSVFDWATPAPRLSASYRLDEAGKTTLRFSYARFSEQLGVSDVARVNPLESAQALYSFDDSNGDHIWQEVEPLRFIAPSGYDPAHPTLSPHRTDPGLEPELTDEVLVGLEHAFSSAWIAGLNVTYRQISNIAETRLLVRDGDTVRAATAADYTLEQELDVVLPDGQVRTASFFALDPALAPTGGELQTNGERSREYLGVTLSFNRRPTDRWMMRGYVNWGEAVWGVPPSFLAFSDPTDVAGFGDNDDDLYAAQGRGFRSDVFLQSTWSAQWSGYYRVAPERPWGFTVASSFFAREGYPIPYMSRFVSQVDGIDRHAQVTDGIGEFRADDVYVLDFSLEKEFRFRRRFKAMLSLAAFNLLNENFVLQRERDVTSPRADHLEETLAPRIVRLGLRLTW